MKKEITTKELVPLKKKINVLAEEAKNLVIEDAKGMERATIVLSNINKYVDSVKEQKEKLTTPINTALKNIRSMFKPLEESYEEAVEVIRDKMVTYHDEQTRIKKEEEEKIAGRIKSGKGNLTIEKAVEKISKIEPVSKEISTSEGLVQMRKTKILKITDINLIPREYLQVNESMLLKSLKEGKKVEGAELEETSIVVNYR